MRLICPKCNAQYEVPDEVMPPEGRDVQCSNCGTSWFQEHPDHPIETDAKDEAAAAHDEASELEASPQDEVETLAGDALEDDAPQDEPSLPERRELDPAVAEVLRAEAELEAEARRREADVMESQPDLGLEESAKKPEPKKPPSDAQEPKPRQTPPEDELLAATATAAPGPRRDVLPDIEEINSSLRSNSDRPATTDPGQTAQVEEQERRSSRKGFVLTVGGFAILTLLYVFAPEFAENLPQAAPALEVYVSTVDGGRAWLDTQISAALKWLDEAVSSTD
ncbi:MAG: zinc-ribbon domain-containing protein [Pseudomonadota bacterium]